jgi:maltose alpha-D-glucosyltransferase / alpha-amylase
MGGTMTFLMSGYTSAVQKLHYRRAQFYNPDLFDSLHDWRNNSVLRVHNLSGEPREVRLSVDADEEKCVLANLLSSDHSEPDASGRYCMLLEPCGYRWFRVCGLDYLLKRTAV